MAIVIEVMQCPIITNREVSKKPLDSHVSKFITILACRCYCHRYSLLERKHFGIEMWTLHCVILQICITDLSKRN